MSEGPGAADALAGDLVSLLRRHQALPAPFRGTPGGDFAVQTQATTVFAFHFREGVVVAGDRRATAGNQIVTETVDKILDLDRESVLAVAGVPATAFEMARMLRSSFEYFRRSQLQSMSLQGKVRVVARLLRDNLAMTIQGVGIVVPLFVGLNDRREPEIYFYDPLGAQFRAAESAASGSGSEAIRGILRYREKFGDPRPRELDRLGAVQFALRLLATVSEIDSATGGVRPDASSFATLRLLSSAGVEGVSEAEQRDVMAS